MDKKKALKLAIESMKKEKQQIAFDANLAKRLLDVPPMMQKRAAHYDELVEAIRLLEEMRKDSPQRRGEHREAE